MAKIEVKLNQRDVLLQGDIVIIDWKDNKQSVFMVYCLSEPHEPSRKTLCNLDGGSSLCGYCNLGNMTDVQLQKKLSNVANKVTIIKKENLHIIIQDSSQE